MQKLLGDKLYVFDLTPYEITQQTEDASVIYVQNECIDGYKELNVSLADKIEGFNQFVLCVTDPWKEGVEPASEYTLFIGGNYSEYTIKVNDGEPAGPTGRIDGLQSGDAIYFTPTQDREYYTISGNLCWDEVRQHWEIIMGNEDVGVSIEYTAHSINIVAQTPGADSNISIDKVLASPGETVTITFEENHDGVDTILYPNPEVELNVYDATADFVMPAYDVNILVQFMGVTNVYNVEDSSDEVILYKGSGPSGSSAVVKAPDAMWVDGSYETVSPTWRFDEEGEHIVQYKWDNNTVETNFESAPITETYVGEEIHAILSALWGYMGGSLDTPQTYISSNPPNIDGGYQIDTAPTGYIFVPEDDVVSYKLLWNDIASNIYPIGTDPDAI